MRIVVSCTLLLACICLCVESHTVKLHETRTGLEDSSIGKIIQKHYRSVRKDKRHSAPEHKVLEIDHKCGNDHFASNHLVSRTTTGKRSSVYPYGGYTLPIPAAGPMSNNPLALFLNESLLYNDPRACTFVGQKVLIGYEPKVPCTTGTSGDEGMDSSTCIYTCTEDDLLTPQIREFLVESLLPAISEFFSALLGVRRAAGNLILDKYSYDLQGGQCDYDVPFPVEYVSGLGEGIPAASYLLFITARPYVVTGTIAGALACNRASAYSPGEPLGRPLAGIIQFNPTYLNSMISQGMSQYEFNMVFRLTAHELTHALGFTSNLYNTYIDIETSTQREDVTEMLEFVGKGADGIHFKKPETFITTPSVRTFGADYYGCNGVIGVPLENYGSYSTAGSHWEYRVAGDEYMVGFFNPIMAISNMTLSLFEDMGWYTVNKSLAEPMVWGKGTGCGVVGYDQCPSVKCPIGSSALTCSSNSFGKGTCNVGRFSGNLPSEYQHYNDPTIGGSDVGADFCPFVTISVYCTNTSYDGGNTGIGEVYGYNSRCFDYTSSGTTQPACLQIRCMADNSILQVFVEKSWYTCDDDAGEIITDSNTKVSCPPAWKLCNAYNPNKENFAFNRTTVTRFTSDTDRFVSISVLSCVMIIISMLL